MTTRIIIVIVAASFVASTAFSQMRYSRSKSSTHSPTPTPTPLPLIPPKEASLRSQPPPQRTAPTPTPTPSKQVYPQRQSSPQKITPTPTPARQAAYQSQTQPQRPAPMPTPSRQTSVPTKIPAQQPAQMRQATLQPQGPLQRPTPAPPPPKPTPTPVPPPDVKAYLDRQLAKSKDQKFHMTVNGGDLALTPFHVWSQKSTGPNTTSTSVSMRSDEGGVYDIDFLTTGAQVTGIQIHRINGEAVR